MIWQIAARRSTYKLLKKCSVLYQATPKIEKVKAQGLLTLQADRDVLLQELESLRRTYSALCDQESPDLRDPTNAPEPNAEPAVLPENAPLLL